MGQRSQIYVRYNNRDKKGLIANYYQWNYGERMISRARYGIEHIIETLPYDWYYQNKDNVLKLSRILDTNFDMVDVQISDNIISERSTYAPEDNFNDYVFRYQDNNDGKLLIDICEGIIKYAFLDGDADPENIMDAATYMQWDCGEDWKDNEDLSKHDVKTCEDNIRFIFNNAVLMTEEEVKEFLSYNYELALK